jgi:hypothetical protein
MFRDVELRAKACWTSLAIKIVILLGSIKERRIDPPQFSKVHLHIQEAAEI